MGGRVFPRHRHDPLVGDGKGSLVLTAARSGPLAVPKRPGGVDNSCVESRDVSHTERMSREQFLRHRLNDGRSNKVAFVSHCALNQNVRYLGGATGPAATDPTINDLRARGIGIVQMPCPEQRAWGGVLKRRMLRLYGSPIARHRLTRRLTVSMARWWTKAVYRSLARRVATDIRDYITAGCEVTQIIAVGPSPSCGITQTVDLAGAIRAMGRCDLATIDADTVNTSIVSANTVPGRGLYIDALLTCLESHGITVPVQELTLLPEPHLRCWHA